MKKIMLFLIIFLAYTPAFGLQLLSDNEMEAISCQTGVSILVDDVQLSLFIERIAYVDSDGYSFSYFNSGKNLTENSSGVQKIDYFYYELNGLTYQVRIVNGAIAAVQEMRPAR